MSCEKCERTREAFEQARLACRIAGRQDMVAVLFDVEERINRGGG